MHGFAIACNEREIPGIACEERDGCDGPADGNYFLSRHSERAWTNISVQHSDLQPETHPQVLFSPVTKATGDHLNSIHINKQRHSNFVRVTAH